MTPLESKAKDLLVRQWNSAMEALGAFSLNVVPNDPWSIFSLTTSHRQKPGELSFTINPVTFNVPERAGDTRLNVYISVRGWINLDEKQVTNKTLCAVGFGTEAAYFRSKDGILNHVFGVHYDCSLDEVGHPTFHSQQRSYKDRDTEIITHFQLKSADEDPLKNILRNVRIPTAQMDFFALLVQICADHLIDQNSDPEQLKNFDKIRASSAEVHGVTDLLQRLQVAKCTRGGHWYCDATSP